MSKPFKISVVAVRRDVRKFYEKFVSVNRGNIKHRILSKLKWDITFIAELSRRILSKPWVTVSLITSKWAKIYKADSVKRTNKEKL